MIEIAKSIWSFICSIPASVWMMAGIIGFMILENNGAEAARKAPPDPHRWWMMDAPFAEQIEAFGGVDRMEEILGPKSRWVIVARDRERRGLSHPPLPDHVKNKPFYYLPHNQKRDE